MSDFKITFTHPWLLLLIALAFVTTIIPYLKLSKKYRKTRNRIISMILHFVTLTFAILILSGIKFEYNRKNTKNEVILLVDVSDTTNVEADTRDEFVETVLSFGQYDGYRIGVVTFGFDQKYAVPLTSNVKDIYNKYLNAELPDTSASDLAAALQYARGLFNNPKSSKIVLITDGKETDERASEVVRSISAQGTRVDTAYIPTEFYDNDLQLVDVKMPDTHSTVNEEVSISARIQSNCEADCKVQLYDNGKLIDDNLNKDYIEASIKSGTYNATFNHTFLEYGLHEITIEIKDASSDGEAINNKYTTYIDIQKFAKVLVLRRDETEGNRIADLLIEQEFEVESKLITDDIPLTVDELREYDQVVLNNISNKDMPDGFIDVLHDYVAVYGGGLLTTGGDQDPDVDIEDRVANMYNREDLFGTTYQQMLPVQAINYTPPVAVMVIIDTSGSMSIEDNGKTRVEWAKDGAIACMKALTERDYMGIMTLDEEYSSILELTPRTQETRIKNAIGSIGDATGGTVFSSAIDRAGQALVAMNDIDKRHIILISDGEPGDGPGDYEPFIQAYYEKFGITLSIITIGDGTNAEDMQHAVDLCNGEGRLYALDSAADIVSSIRRDLTCPEIKDVDYEDVPLVIADKFSSLLTGIVSYDKDDNDKTITTNLLSEVHVYKFYGTKIRTSASLVLTGPYNVPIYAQWKYGEGMVGSFLLDFDEDNSTDEEKDMFAAEGGQLFIKNVVTNLMPTKDIRPKDIVADLISDNYINEVNIYSSLEKGEKIEGVITKCNDEGAREFLIDMTKITNAQDAKDFNCYITTNLNNGNNYSRCVFVLKDSGVYTITLNKYNSSNELVSTCTLYKEFSYSKEYDTLDAYDEETVISNLDTIAKKGNGVRVEDIGNPEEVFEGFITKLHKSFDPRFLLMIIAIILFLLDVVVRKFKFKWIHEIIRERKENE